MTWCMVSFYADFSTLYHLLQVQNCYKIKKDASSVTKPATPKQKVVWPQRQSPASGLTASNDTIMEAADNAAYRVADAESKSFLASEALREAERISCIAEYADSMLQLAKEIYEQCTTHKQSYLLTSEFCDLMILNNEHWSCASINAGSRGEIIPLA